MGISTDEFFPSLINEDEDSLIDPRSRFEDPDLFYSIDNVQVSDVLNIEEREEAIAQAWDLYHLNLESNPTSSNPFWEEDWNEIAEGIKSDERYLRRLRRCQARGYNFDELDLDEEDFNSDSDSSVEDHYDGILPAWLPNLREKQGGLDLLMFIIFMTFFSMIAGLQNCEMFRKNYCNVVQCFYQHKAVELQRAWFPTPGADPMDEPWDPGF